MAIFWVVLSIGVIALIVVVAMSNDDFEKDIYCEDDVPCQECGKCYGDHPGSAFGGHSYTYPRDLHR